MKFKAISALAAVLILGSVAAWHWWPGRAQGPRFERFVDGTDARVVIDAQSAEQRRQEIGDADRARVFHRGAVVEVVDHRGNHLAIFRI